MNLKFFTITLVLSFFLLFSLKPTVCFAQNNDFFKALVAGEEGRQMSQDYFIFKGTENITNSLNIIVSGAPTSIQNQVPNTQGAIPIVGNLIAGLISNPPVSTREYLADLGSNLGLPIKSVYAQGTGWQALRPVLPVWKAFRNVAYMAFVIIFVVIGFMIMFRAKINPQTVISIQAALPRIIVTLLLVTFSYAIAGLMIDLIYIGIYLVVAVLNLAGLITDTEQPLHLLLTRNPFNLVFMGNGADIFLQAPGEAIQNIISGFVGAWGAEGLANITGGLAKLVLGVALLFSLFKLFFSLLLSYLGIIISVIFAPINILFNALPGSSSFIGWLKNLFANVIVFPAVAGMFLVAAIIIGPRQGAECGTLENPNFNNRWCVQQGVGYYPQAEDGKEVWVPPMLTLGGRGGAGEVNTFQALIALGIIMIMPKIVTMIKKMLKVEPSGFGGTIAAGIMAGPRMIAAVPQTGWNLMTQLGYQPLRKEQTVIVRPEVPSPGES